MFFKTVLLETLQYSQDNICAEDSFDIVAGLMTSNFIQPRPKRHFNTGDPCENRKIFTNSFFHGTHPVAAFVILK